MISQRVRTIEPSATLEFNARLQKMRAEGRKVFNFSVGEPDFPTPNFIRARAMEAMEEGWTRYTPVAGHPEARAAIARYVSKTRGHEVTPEEVVISSGGKQSLSQALLSIADPGDEVLLPAPYWVSYPDLIRLAEAIPVVVPSSNEGGYRVTPEALEEFVTPRTAGIILNSPSNPTGSVYDRSQMEALVSFAEDHDLWIISDEIYEHFVFEGEMVSPFEGRGRERTILISGLSKSFSMTGWRIGWSVCDRSIAKAMSRLQSHNSSNACTLSQACISTALEGVDHPEITEMLTEFSKRRILALELLESIDGLGLFRPEGAFYIFFDISNRLGRDGIPDTVDEVCLQLLEAHGVAVIPGPAFGDKGGVRLSYARPAEELKEGIGLLASYLAGESN